MKTKLIALMLAFVCLCGALAGCSKDKCAHKDENKDMKCDKCKESICVAHEDDNKDLACDNCAAALPSCEAHKDENPLDNACDVCKVHMPCTPHKDANADTFCDVCGGAIVVNSEQINSSTEERVAMTVTPIPENANVGDYIVTDKKDADIITGFQAIDTPIAYTEDLSFLLLSSFNAEGTITTYKVYDVANRKAIHTVSTAPSVGDSKNVSVELYDYYFKIETVETKTVEIYHSETVSRTVDYYTYANDRIAGRQWVKDSESDWNSLFAEILPETIYHSDTSIAYRAFGNKVWAFDAESRQVINNTFDKLNLVYRPIFDEVCKDKYGYIEKDGKIYVYNLNNWIDCVYSYDIPDHYEGYNWFVLENGTVLIQAQVLLHSNAISYDVLYEDKKYDLVYTVADPAAKTEKAVEFGYFIHTLAAADKEAFTAKASNVAIINPIVDDVVSFQPKVVVVNNDLTIAADVTDAINYELLSDGLFKKTESIGESEKTTVVDANGKEKKYIPYGAIFNEECISYDGDLYSFEMNKILELDDYEVSADHGSYMLLYQINETDSSVNYYCYDPLTNKLTSINASGTEAVSIVDYAMGYVVYRNVGDAEPEYRYDFYDVNGSFVKSFNSRIYEIQALENTYIVLLADGTYHIATVK